MGPCILRCVWAWGSHGLAAWLWRFTTPQLKSSVCIKRHTGTPFGNHWPKQIFLLESYDGMFHTDTVLSRWCNKKYVTLETRSSNLNTTMYTHQSGSCLLCIMSICWTAYFLIFLSVGWVSRYLFELLTPKMSVHAPVPLQQALASPGLIKEKLKPAEMPQSS